MSIDAASVSRFFLYFSNQCQHSTRFRQMLIKKPDLEAKFIQLCIDKMPSGKIPKFVRSVPFIVVADEKGRPLHLTDSGAFNWLKRELDQHAGDFEAYDSTAMSSSLSDSFAFIDSETAHGSGAAHTFEWIDGHQADLGGAVHSLYTPQEDSYGGGMKDKYVPEDAMGKIMSQRSKDLEHFAGVVTKPPDEIDFTKPLSQQAFMKQPKREAAQYNEEARRREARQALGPQSRQGIDFGDPNFKLSAPRSAPPPSRQPHQPPKGRGIRPAAVVRRGGAGGVGVSQGRGRGAGPVGRRLPQNVPRK